MISKQEIFFLKNEKHMNEPRSVHFIKHARVKKLKNMELEHVDSTYYPVRLYFTEEKHRDHS